MIEEHIAIFCCPISRQPLSILTAPDLAKLGEELTSGQRLHADSSPVRLVPVKAIGTPDRRYVYGIEDEILALLPGLAIVAPTDRLRGVQNAEKVGVQRFYDEVGWVRDDQDQYYDSKVFTATSENAQRYVNACNRRTASKLGHGKYLLDAASGPVPPLLVPLSRNYVKRVCVDFSVRALREAKRNLPPSHGIFVLGDLTRLPFAEGAMDDVISLHTLYHLPAEQQTSAVDELVRVVRPGGCAIIVYTWDRSPLMEMTAKFTMAVGRLKVVTRGPKERTTISEDGSASNQLYFHSHGHAWFRTLKARHGARLRLSSAAGASFQKAFFRPGIAGRIAASVVFWLETIGERFAARYGQYPMFVIRKKVTLR